MPAWFVVILSVSGDSTPRSGFPISIAVFWIGGMVLWLTAISFSILGAVRASQGGGVGGQVLYGSILGVIAVSEILQPDLAGIAWPLVLVAIGILLLVRGRSG